MSRTRDYNPALVVFERFVRHDMTPVTGGLTNGKKIGLFSGRAAENASSPRIPIDRIMSVLEKVGEFSARAVCGSERRRRSSETVC